MINKKVDYLFECSNSSNIINDLKIYHKLFPLSDEKTRSLFDMPDNVIAYIISLLNDETPVLPNISISEWYELFEVLNVQWLLPLMYWQIMHISNGVKPPNEAINVLRQKFLINKAILIRLDPQLKELLDKLHENNIRVIVLKGAALSRTLYPDTALRVGSDIDLLVMPENMEYVRKLLIQMGYSCLKEQFKNYKYWYCEEEFIYSDSSKNYLPVEIHWDINQFPLFRSLPIHQLFERSKNVAIPGMSFEILDPVDNIIYLSMHLILKHNRYIRLIWIYDIFLLCKDLSNEEWYILQKRCIDYDARISVEKALIMAQYWCGLKIPMDFYDFNKWPSPKKVEVFAFQCAMNRYTDRKSEFYLLWPKYAPIKEKIMVLSYRLFPLPQDMASEYDIKNNLLLPFFYFKRLLNLLLRR